jgi:hypothetical protein
MRGINLPLYPSSHLKCVTPIRVIFKDTIENQELPASNSGRIAVDRLTLSFPIGAVFGFLGPSGAVKLYLFSLKYDLYGINNIDNTRSGG